MTDTIVALVAIALPLLFVGVAVSLFVRSRRRVLGAFSELAQQRGLRVARGGYFGDLLVQGEHRGFEIELRTYPLRMPTGAGTAVATCFELRLPRSLPFSFQLSASGLGSRFPGVLDGERISFGEDAFQQAVVARSDSPEHLARVMSPELRERAVAFGEAWRLHVGGPVLEWSRAGLVKDAQELQLLLETLMAIATAANESSP